MATVAIKFNFSRYNPKTLRPALKRLYYRVTGQTNDQLHRRFVEDLFTSRNDYQNYVHEFDSGPFDEIRESAFRRFKELTEDIGFGDISVEVARDFYAIIRSRRPNTIVETGVCNGVSSLAILLALEENGKGHCYSIDLPYRVDAPLEEFRRETFEEYAGAAIPSDKDPGWIIPTELRDRWTLRIGKSQVELPKLRSEVNEIDCFFHDSEHSAPCMMFEFELAWAWLRPGGLLFADDITWTDVFDQFAKVRNAPAGRLNRNVGYLRKPE